MSEKTQRYKRQLQKTLGTLPKVKYERKFLGKLKDFENKEEKRKEQKHLSAYLRGLEKYTYGFTHVENPYTGKIEAIPTSYEVKQELNIIK